MDDVTAGDLLRSFEDLEDPRGHNTVHPMGNILIIAIMGVTCDCSGWKEVSRWGKTHAEWLENWLDMPHGVPSADTFRRFFTALDPDSFERCFIIWTAELVPLSGGKLIAFDGKTARGSGDAAGGRSPLHMLSAWCEDNRVVLGQVATEQKSNEITAIPKLLQLLDLKGATVSIDAAGCQKDIATAIIKGEGDYLLTVKDNHPTLHEDLKLFFEDATEQHDPGLISLGQPQVDGGHGRIETRQLWASGDVAWLKRWGIASERKPCDWDRNDLLKMLMNLG